jgi:hypothetical protein
VRSDDSTEEFDNVTCVKETAKAIACIIDGRTMWVPKAVVDDDSSVFEEGQSGKLVLKSWWVEKEGLG